MPRRSPTPSPSLSWKLPRVHLVHHGRRPPRPVVVMAHAAPRARPATRGAPAARRRRRRRRDRTGTSTSRPARSGVGHTDAGQRPGRPRGSATSRCRWHRPGVIAARPAGCPLAAEVDEVHHEPAFSPGRATTSPPDHARSRLVGDVDVDVRDVEGVVVGARRTHRSRPPARGRSGARRVRRGSRTSARAGPASSRSATWLST